MCHKHFLSLELSSSLPEEAQPGDPAGYEPTHGSPGGPALPSGWEGGSHVFLSSLVPQAACAHCRESESMPPRVCWGLSSVRRALPGQDLGFTPGWCQALLETCGSSPGSVPGSPLHGSAQIRCRWPVPTTQTHMRLSGLHRGHAKYGPIS